MISFILNEEHINTDQPPGMTVLDFVRYHRHLMGTKFGCREGDCGACTVMIGTLGDDKVRYRTMTSCLTPLSNVEGKHVVTVEGINPKDGSLTAVQEAMVAESGTQCGFCTVGFIMSLTGFCLDDRVDSQEAAISAIDGNICRCTGYKSIERAAGRLTTLVNTRNDAPSLSFGIEKNIVPAYFAEIPARLSVLKHSHNENADALPPGELPTFVGGGTDLYVQQPEAMEHAAANHLFDTTALKGIRQTGDRIEIGANVTVTDLMESALMQEIFPHLYSALKLVSSTPIRNMATVAGNLINASPIGDITSWLLALNASIVLQGATTREIPLKDFFLGYKKLDKKMDEMVTMIHFRRPAGHYYFNFEKVSKRTYLDIASVNSAMLIRLENDIIVEAHLSAGGVGPIPLYLKKTAAFMAGKDINDFTQWVAEAASLILSEISPISDIRGTADYKKLLMRQLFKAHFSKMLSLT